jgi:hypothetical protein
MIIQGDKKEKMREKTVSLGHLFEKLPTTGTEGTILEWQQRPTLGLYTTGHSSRCRTQLRVKQGGKTELSS